MVSTFIQYEGNTSKNRIMEFLVTFAVEDDYSMSDIARNSKVSYATVKNMWHDFIEKKIVVFTRNVGKAKLFKLNRHDPIVRKFVLYYWKIVEEGSTECEKKKCVSRSAAIASAKRD